MPDSYESSKAAAAEASAFADSKDGSSIIVFKRADGGKLRAADRGEIADAVKRLNAARVEHVVGVETGKQLISPKGDTQLAAVKFDAPTWSTRPRTRPWSSAPRRRRRSRAAA